VPSKGAVDRTLAVSYEYIRTWGTPGEVRGRVIVQASTCIVVGVLRGGATTICNHIVDYPKANVKGL
jgi:hypothetical protein